MSKLVLKSDSTTGNICLIEPGNDAWIVGGEVSPDEANQAAVMDAWMAWFGEIGPSIVDMGSPFGATATIASNGSVSEGGGSDPATGYTVIEAADIDAAVDRAKGCPGLSSGGTLKVYEAVQMG
jgi:hypothetical protein